MADETKMPGLQHTSGESIIIETLLQTDDKFYRALLKAAEFDLPSSILNEEVYSDPAGKKYFKIAYSESRPSFKNPGEDGVFSGMGYKGASYVDDKFQHGKQFTIEELNSTPDKISDDAVKLLMDWYDYWKYDVILKSLIDASAATGAGVNMKFTAPGGVALFSASTSVFHVGKNTSAGHQYDGNLITNSAAGYPSTPAGWRLMCKEFYTSMMQELTPDGRSRWGKKELSKPSMILLVPSAYAANCFEWLSENLISLQGTATTGNVSISNELPTKFLVQMIPVPWATTGYTYMFSGNRDAEADVPLNIFHRKLSFGVGETRDWTAENGNQGSLRFYRDDEKSEDVKSRETAKAGIWWNEAAAVGPAHGTARAEMA